MPRPNKYDAQHLRNIGLTQRQINSIFDEAVKEAAAIGTSIHDFNPGKPFSFDDYPQTKARIDKLIKQLQRKTETVIINGARSAWTLANNKNNALCDRVFGDNKYKITKEQQRKYYKNNDKALEAFIKRKQAGLNLSGRVWNYTGQFKAEIEMALDIGIRDGVSAAEMTHDLQQYLKEPDKLFRRVRDEHGQLHLSKAAKAYHPGQGIYRSSYKNARRLAATETNIAYRTADHERWQQLDFVVGIEIQLSNNHTINGIPFTDICDDLKGKYPKDFKFTGWHPLCRCIALSILKTPEELLAGTEATLEGKDPDTHSINEVKDIPANFTKWVENNKERIERAKSLPYFLQDNSTYIGNKTTLTKQAAAQIKEAAAQSPSVTEIKPMSKPADGFSIYKEYSNSGRIEMMNNYTKKSDHKDLLTIAREWAHEGKTVQITTGVHYKDDMYTQVFGALNGTKYERKCPDLIINGLFYEYENYTPPFKKGKISHMIKKGTKQSSRIIINNNKGSVERYIHRNILERLKDKNFKYDIDEVWLYEKGKVRRIF